MTSFAQAIQTTPIQTTTTNGMPALESSLKATVDLFFAIGASRGKNIIPEFEMAYQEDAIIATKIALWARDIREGAGERQTFRNILLHLEQTHPDMLDLVLPKILELGRSDDLLIFKTEAFQQKAFGIIKEELKNHRYNIGKWLPREKSAKKGIAVKLRKYLNLSPKQYRQLLVLTSDVVETKMCAKQFDKIDFETVPSLASSRYQAAFLRNCPVEYENFKRKLSDGTAKINAGAVYPYDIIKSMNVGDIDVSIAQWDALPNYIGDKKILPMVDVSGSMECPVNNTSKGSYLSCMDVAISLGLYCADKNTGAFKDVFLTFSEKPTLSVLKGNIHEKYAQLQQSDWGYNTNIHLAFKRILNVAVTNNVSQDDMPDYLAIFSDMNFDSAMGRKSFLSCYDLIVAEFNEAGYEKVPAIIFWNLNAQQGHCPVSYDTLGTCMVSGFSPSLMTTILSGENMTPESIMLQTINKERYNLGE